MVLTHNVTLAQDTVVMCVFTVLIIYALFFTVDLRHFGYLRVWISSADAAAVAARNFRIIHAASDYFYLVSACIWVSIVYLYAIQDCGHGEWVGNNPLG
jgi:hexosaminidase